MLTYGRGGARPTDRENVGAGSLDEQTVKFGDFTEMARVSEVTPVCWPLAFQRQTPLSSAGEAVDEIWISVNKAVKSCCDHRTECLSNAN